MSLSLLVSAWLVGTLGGMHCISMCGGFVAAIAARDNLRSVGGAGTVPLLPARTIMRRQLGDHICRIGMYMLLGAVFGVGGAALWQLADLPLLQRALYGLANAFLLLSGINLAFDRRGMKWLQRAATAAFETVLPLARPLLRHAGGSGRIALGLLWGLVPCALVYSVLPLAMFAGGAWQGAAVMLAFGIGTLPNLAAASLLIGGAKSILARPSIRFAAAALIAGFSIVGIYRAWSLPDAVASGIFCL